MACKIIIEGVLLGALLVLFCTVGIRKGAVTMAFLYHRDVQDRCVQNGLITRERIWQNRKIFKGLGVPLYFTFVLVSVYAVNGARGFWSGLWQLFAILSIPVMIFCFCFLSGCIFFCDPLFIGSQFFKNTRPCLLLDLFRIRFPDLWLLKSFLHFFNNCICCIP